MVSPFAEGAAGYEASAQACKAHDVLNISFVNREGLSNSSDREIQQKLSMVQESPRSILRKRAVTSSDDARESLKQDFTGA